MNSPNKKIQVNQSLFFRFNFCYDILLITTSEKTNKKN